ncbi:hypothetical protein WJX74_008712 [Apatococcus lobatus]|uniref:NAD(P)-binding domain-containing protein n=2 Tax=Apatococcus TaxID=904362 RepID=A0AAW1RI58_9CHLO
MICSQPRLRGAPGLPQARLATSSWTRTGPVDGLLPSGSRLAGRRQLHRQHSVPSARRCSLCVRAAGGLFGGSNEVFVAGAAGQLGVRVVLQLLDAGIKVAAGVPDKEEAQNLLNFAKTYELIKKDNQSKLRLVEVDPTTLVSSIPAGGTVLAVAGDSTSGKGIDARLASGALSAAKEAGAKRFVLITPQGGAASGGGLLGLFGLGGGGGSNGRSSLEQEVISSGLSFVIIRHGKNDFSSSKSRGGSAGLQLGPEGSLPTGASYQPQQVAAATAGALQQAASNVILEAWADPSAPYTPVADLLGPVLPSAAVEDAAEVSRPEPEPAAQQEEESPKPKRKGGLLGANRGSLKAAQNGSEPEDEKPAAGLFGGRSAWASKRSAEAEDDSSSPSPGGVLGGLLGGAKQEAQSVQPDGKSARKAAARASKAQAAAAKQSGRKAGDRPGDEEESGGSWLSLLGIGQKTSFVDEE